MTSEPFDPLDSQKPGDPPGETVARQSGWAWAWPLLPWALLIVVQMFIGGDPIFMMLFVFLAAVMTFPRYLRWKNTSYKVSDEGVTVSYHTFSGPQEFQITISEIINVDINRGFMGQLLGYKALDLVLSDGGIAKLTFVMLDSTLDQDIQTRIGASR